MLVLSVKKQARDRKLALRFQIVEREAVLFGMSPFRRVSVGLLFFFFLCASVVPVQAGQGTAEPEDRLSLIFEKKMLPIEVRPPPYSFAAEAERKMPTPPVAPSTPRSDSGSQSESATHDRVAVTDKPLVLGGRGLGIRQFQHAREADRHPDFLKRLENPYPYPAPVSPPAVLDLALSDIKSTKHLIYRPLRPALGRIPDVDPDKDARVPSRHRVALDAIPETHLEYFKQERTGMRLLPAAERMDVLIGNENVNREDYKNWDR